MIKKLKNLLCNHNYIYARTEVYNHTTYSVYVCVTCGKKKRLKIKEAE